MQIISHRGYWLKPEEKNREISFRRSFDMGIGTETDVRDYCGELVISHDIPTEFDMKLVNLLELMDGRNLPLALNVKSDGLVDELTKTLYEYGHTNWFAFDMSVPDMRTYLEKTTNVYTRVSEVETGVWMESCSGVWLDSFVPNEWIDEEFLYSFRKSVCIVSPELHKREHNSFWEYIRDCGLSNKFTLCTDFPEDALNFFGEQND